MRPKFMERRVQEALGGELAQALVMIYCRHLHHPPAMAAMRAMAQGERAILAEFDALDALHAEVPFQDLGHLTVREELELLYWHQVQRGAHANVGQLRRLCAHDPALTTAFARLDALAGEGA
jgi:hypothetical protein